MNMTEHMYLFRKMLGQRIKKERLSLGISQTELAKSVYKSSPAYIAFIEAGERNVSAVDLMLIAKVLGVHMKDFFNFLPND